MAAAVCSSGTWAGAAACRAAPPNRVPVGILTATNRRATTSNSAASNASRPCPRRGAVVAAAVSDPEEVDVAAPTSAAGVSRALEFMVEMACGKCVSRVEAAVAQVPGRGPSRLDMDARDHHRLCASSLRRANPGNTRVSSTRRTTSQYIIHSSRDPKGLHATTSAKMRVACSN
jgi:copper chaperone CopZ